MAVLAVAAAGAWAGSALITGTVLGMSGAAIGWMAGSMLGNSLFAPTQKSQGPKLNDLTVSGSAYGQPIPWVAGSPRIAGQVVWASNKREIATTQSAGGKGGGGGSEYTSYTYEVDLLILLTDNEIAGVSRIWSNGKLVYNIIADADDATISASIDTGGWSRMTVYGGNSAQLPDPTYESAVGTANAPAYRGRGSVFIQSLQLGGSGQIPNLTFEVYTLGTVWEADPLVRLSTMMAGNTTDLSSYAVGDGAYNGTIGSWTQASNHIYYTQINTGYCVWRYDDAGFRRGTAEAVTVEFLFGAVLRASRNSGSSTIASCNVAGGLLCRLQAAGASGGVNRLYMDTNPGPNVTSYGPDYFNGMTHHAAWVFTTDNKLYCFIDGASVGGPYTVPGGSVINFLELGGYYHGAYANTHKIYGARITKAALYSGATYTVPIDFTADYGSVAVTLIDTSLTDVVGELVDRSGLSVGEYDTSELSSITTPVHSMAISQVSSARTLLEMLASTYHFEAVLSDKIYFRPRGGAPVATLTFDELGVVQDSTNPPDPLPLTQANELEIPAQLALTYNNVDGDYQTDTQYSDRLLTGMESTSAMQLPMGFTASEAKQIVDTMLLDKAVSALSTSITLDTSRAALQPTDVLLITGEDSSSYRMRIVKRTDASGVTTLQCVSDNASVLTQAGTTSGGTASQTTVATLASTSLELMDIPLLRDADNAPGHYVAVKGSNSNWTNCALYDSPDDITFTQAATISGAAVMGSCTSTLGNWTGGNFADEAHTLTVSVGSGQLYSATHEGMLSNSATNAALVGGEIIQFREAALVSAGVYTLRGLLRGRRGTETAMVGHVANERFVLLAMTGLRFVPRSAADFGRTVYYKAATASQKLSAVASQNLVFQSRNLLPMRPTNVRVNAESADTLVSWDRRTRVAENWLLGSVPLGEPVESWKIEVYAGATLKRTLTSTTASVTYTNAQRYEDFGGAAGSVDFAVYQISTYVGQGDSVTTTTVVPVTTPPVNPSAFISTDLIYPVCKAGSAFIAIRTSFSGSMAQHQLLQSTNGGATLTAVSSASVFLSKKMATARADGVYVSLPQCQVPNSSFKEFEAFSRAGEISIMRGVAGSVARYAASALPLGSDPMGIGCNGSNFYILTEGNHVWKSTDGDTWTDTGAASGFPYTFSSSYDKNIATRNYTHSSNLHWTGSAWLFAFSNKLYRTSDADALSGWAEVAWAGAYYYGPTKFVQAGTVILAALYEYNNPSMMRFERSADHGATWSVVWDRQAISPAALPLHLTLAPPIAIDGEFVASTSNGEYRRIYSSANGTVWTIGSNDPNAGWSTYMDQISDGTNVLGYSRGYLADFVYSPDGMTYLASDTP